MFENRVLMKKSRAKRYEIQGSGEDYITRSLVICTVQTNINRVNKSRRMRWAGHVARTGENRSAYRVLAEIPQRKRPLGRP